MNHKPILDFFQRHGVPTLELELGPNTPSHIGEVTLVFGIFDGFALAILDNSAQVTATEPQFQFIKLTYPKLSEISTIEYYRNLIRESRFANQIERNRELFSEDAAICLGIAHDITDAEFKSSLKSGLTQLDKYPKHLPIFCNEEDFYRRWVG